MKKLHVLIMALGFIATTSASAQTKIAYVRIDDIVSVMPELAPEKVDMDTIGAKFIQDSIMPTVNYKQEQYNQKIKDYSDTTKKLSDQIKKLMLKEIQDLQTELGGVDQYLQQVQQSKQQEFLRPYYAKAKKAIEQVAKEKNYTHVMNTDVFLVAPEADDISFLVLAKLGIKLPQQEKSAATKPAVKTNGN
ncbi:MAG TPA: OmpH family outer membrane protein [Chitinophagaceae bacterium]|nr:OmpH family outer membrane protein [Chitinophagaceae bacterium]HNC39545.1 OmpH family outer membrane protein [Chitinophagaceae bacterium]